MIDLSLCLPLTYISGSPPKQDINSTHLFRFIPVMALNVEVPNDQSPPLSFPRRGSSTTLTGIFGTAHDKIELPQEVLLDNSNHRGLSKSVFFSYKSLHEILAQGDMMNVKQIRDDPSGSKHWTVNSRIISASLAKGRHIQLSKPVIITLKHLITESNMSNPICVFWNFEMSSWSDHGCRVLETNESSTKCECDHLTNFALLMKEASETEGVFVGGSESVGGTLFVLQIVAYVAIVIAFILLCFVAYKVTD